MKNYYYEREYFRKGNGIFRFLFADKDSDYYINYLEKKSFYDLLEDKLLEERYVNIYRFDNSNGIVLTCNDSATKIFNSYKPKKTIQSLKNLFNNNQIEKPQEKFRIILDIMSDSKESDTAVIIPISLLNEFLEAKNVEKKLENIIRQSRKNIIIILSDIYEEENIEYFCDKNSSKCILKSDKFFPDIDEMFGIGKKYNNSFVPVFPTLKERLNNNYIVWNPITPVSIRGILLKVFLNVFDCGDISSLKKEYFNFDIDYYEKAILICYYHPAFIVKSDFAFYNIGYNIENVENEFIIKNNNEKYFKKLNDLSKFIDESTLKDISINSYINSLILDYDSSTHNTKVMKYSNYFIENMPYINKKYDEILQDINSCFSVYDICGYILYSYFSYNLKFHSAKDKLYYAIYVIQEDSVLRCGENQNLKFDNVINNLYLSKSGCEYLSILGMILFLYENQKYLCNYQKLEYDYEYDYINEINLLIFKIINSKDENIIKECVSELVKRLYK